MDRQIILIHALLLMRMCLTPFLVTKKDCCGGNGIAGIYAFNYFFPDNGKEYIQTHLTDTLKAGRKYLASMHVNTCDMYNYAIATMGMYFTNTSMPWPTNVGFINVPNPQIKNTVLLADTLNWLTVQDTFIAQGGEVYLTIGNFSYDSLSDTVKLYQQGWGNNNEYSYYYIDGVSVYDVTAAACNSYWDAGLDKYIHQGDSIRLGALNTDNSNFMWQNSSGGSTFLSSNVDPRPYSSPTVTTTYYVTKACPNNVVFQDTVTVHVDSATGIFETNKNKALNIFPNPSRGSITINYSLKTDAVLTIEDLSGRTIDKFHVPSSSESINITTDKVQNGIYVYHLTEGNSTYSGKIVIMK